PMGVAGVMAGTVAGHLLIFMGRTVVVYRYFTKKPPREYYVRFLGRILIFAAAASGTVWVVGWIPAGLGGVIAKGVVSVLVSTVVFLLYGFRREEFGVLLSYVKAVVFMVARRRERKNG
ncbi:MAG: hypothetical protein K2P07_10760, partial [Lachnospiraceae bacterium]|nr:hypothetical protein [Lachnospiraceae bacterium]